MVFRWRIACLAAALLAATGARCRAADFVDAAGRHLVLPERIARVMPADDRSDVLVLVLAPEKLMGWNRPLTARQKAYLPARYAHLPILRPLDERDLAGSINEVARLRPDVVVDSRPITPERTAFADAVMQSTGVPYAFVDVGVAHWPMMLIDFGATLGNAARGADLSDYSRHAIDQLRGRLLIRPASERPTVYFALGRDGLHTATPRTAAGEAIDEAGALNVAARLTLGPDASVNPRELMAVNPEIIIAEDRLAYNTFLRSPAWRSLTAVRKKQVYLEPGSPFGWIEDPSGVNRLIGLYWLSSLFYPDMMQENMRTTTCDFYDKFYRIKLTNAAVDGMLKPAGVLRPETDPLLSGPLISLGKDIQMPVPIGNAGSPLPAAPPPSTSPPGNSANAGNAAAMPGMPALPSSAPGATCTAATTGPTPQ
ncbi:MAG: ABC transporter substrate-binding protein, partial [Alphaproteobacteria bacterium]|nr:ABC transporter substrate-binding protein [Alphaproteobacteria bacterium]